MNGFKVAMIVITVAAYLNTKRGRTVLTQVSESLTKAADDVLDDLFPNTSSNKNEQERCRDTEDYPLPQVKE